VKSLQAYEKISAEAVENAYLLEKKIAEIEKVAAQIPGNAVPQELNAWIESEKAMTNKLKDDFRFQLGQQLKSMFESGSSHSS
jgi:hypothetical protein